MKGQRDVERTRLVVIRGVNRLKLDPAQVPPKGLPPGPRSEIRVYPVDPD
jgi:hypothetical protein